MSHYTVAVISKDPCEVEELLERYDESIKVEPYICSTREEIINRAKDLKLKWIKDMHTYDAETLLAILTEDKYHYTRTLLACETDEDFLNYERDGCEDDFDDEGNEWSTYNPDSKWDWYSIGGRWSDSFYDKVKQEWCNSVRICNWDMDYEDEYHDKFNCTYAIVTPDGEWFAPGNMGWWGMSSETEDEWKKWEENFATVIGLCNPTWFITLVDCHI